MGDRSRGLSFRACEGKSGRLFVTKTHFESSGLCWPALLVLAGELHVSCLDGHINMSLCTTNALAALSFSSRLNLTFRDSCHGLLPGVSGGCYLKSEVPAASCSFDTSMAFLVTSWHHVLS